MVKVEELNEIVEDLNSEIQKMESLNSLTTKILLEIKNDIREIKLLSNNPNKLSNIKIYDWDKTLDIALKARDERDLERKKQRVLEKEKKRIIGRNINEKIIGRRKRKKTIREEDIF